MITKEQWSEIEKDLQACFARVEFKLGEDKILVQRCRITEDRSKLFVFLNGWIKGSWSADQKSGDYMPLVEMFWRKVARRSLFYYSPSWPKAKSLVNHFKKIKDLELVHRQIKML
ncbi:MAG: hypothetical protein WDA26_13340 [Pusillimonas sp.]